MPLPFLLSKLSNLLNANEILSEWHLILWPKKSWNSSQKKVDKFITNEMYLCELFLNSKLKWSVWGQIPFLLSVFLSIPLNEQPYDNQLFFIFEEIKQLLFNRMKILDIQQNFYDFYAKSFSFISSKERISKFHTKFSVIKSLVEKGTKDFHPID